jgi:hypothetical protein
MGARMSVLSRVSITFDQNGNATGVLGSLPTYSWTGYQYQVGSTKQVVPALLGFGLSWAPFLNAVHFPIDWKSNDKAADVLSPTMWQKFAGSNCAAVFQSAASWSVPNYSLLMAQRKGRMTNFYDISNPGVGNLQLQTVTAGQYGSNVTLTRYLANAWAATANFARYDNQTAVVLKPIVWSQPHPEFILVHEILIHAYFAWDDNAAFSAFRQNGLWRPDGSTASSYISTWMSTDCTCTPGQPGTTCQANTAKW